ncbi:uncharacterized protein VDAG_04894 [Verticillium dahliae VdLs.17]|uniref:NmrA-like domain-containing protein n=1 Tax=Verticillium dahliae (strain VdLs.17 / ATCC MYA-4575 / FGSC 10137) TaxID=498257 RepID=G2X3A9_VERDV|nr:uncharacterized protein VDAG_04894 [Verticillium dahliae VdLs.17]EGY23456.1 hypothetical protein VDAG_04894 [Verticillium dahliae VdLs.17]
MAIIAVAGGTGNLGRTLVKAIVANGKHEVRILGRKANPDLEKTLGAAIIPVDYTDIVATTKILEDNNIHTVVSAIAMLVFGDAPPEVELIRAADASKTTKRFIASGWGIPHTKDQASQLVSVPHKLNAARALEETKDLEYTIVHNGMLLDYWTTKSTEMSPFSLIVDVAHKVAAIPGDGNTPVAFTHTSDVAEYVTVLLDAEEWDADSTIVGDKVTWNEFVRLAEAAHGAKFDVRYDTLEDLKNGKVTELPSQVAAYQFVPKEVFQGFCITFGQWFALGAFDLTPSKVLPGLKPLTVKDALEYK